MFYDRKLDASLSAANEEPEEPFRVKDIVSIVSNKGFWLIALLCLLFYSAVFPFIKYATDLMMQKYNVDSELAGTIPGLLPFGTIFLTPLFGSLYDRIGKGASLMIAGSMMLIVVHVLFALPILDYWWFAAIIMLILGVAFSLVPSAMWPSVPKIIPERQLGTAYALIFWVQNWGLSGVPLLIGWELNAFCKTEVVDGVQRYDYTIPMVTFVVLSALALIVGLMLKAEDKKKGYGLELPNIKK
jgi:nitrate/nitrite transporter NarK